jgi:large subunit ribosomal protein L33
MAADDAIPGGAARPARADRASCRRQKAETRIERLTCLGRMRMFRPLGTRLLRSGSRGGRPAAGTAAAVEGLRTTMAKTNTIQIKLVSSADTGYFYVTKKNARAQTGKLEMRKYDPVARKHVAFREAKIK